MWCGAWGACVWSMGPIARRCLPCVAEFEAWQGTGMSTLKRRFDDPRMDRLVHALRTWGHDCKRRGYGVLECGGCERAMNDYDGEAVALARYLLAAVDSEEAA